MDARRRKVLRIPGYDYSTPGSYFVTIRANDRYDRFSAVNEGLLRLTPAGTMLVEQWNALGERFPDVLADDFVAMPDHVHGILWLEANGGAGERTSLGRIMQAYKSLTTHEYARGVRELEWPPFAGRLWQPNYYEHIIRSDQSLDRHREYITSHPSRRWMKRGS